MKAKKQDYKRIHFQLPLSLAREFELAAKKEGVTKAKLLRKWISVPDSTQVKTISSSEHVTDFNLRLNQSELRTLAITASRLGIRKSSYLRALITSNLAHSDVETEQTLVHTLISAGKLNESAKILIHDFDHLTPDQLLLLAEIYTDLGEFQKAESLITHIFDLNLPNILVKDTLHAKAELIKARVNIYNRDPQATFISLSNVSILSHGLGDDFLKALTLYHFGVFYLMSDKYQESLDYLHKSLELINIQSNTKLVAKIYLRMADAHVHNLNWEQASYYLDRGRELIMQSNNSYDIAWYMNKAEICLHNQQLFNKLHQNVIEYSEYASQSGSLKEIQYHLDNLGRYLLFNRRESEAYSVLLKAEKLDQRYRPDAVFSYSTAYKLFIESKHNYERSIKELEKLTTKASRFRPDTLNHILSTTRYLNAPSQKERSTAEQELRLLAAEGKSKLIRKVAADTLSTKQLQPYR